MAMIQARGNFIAGTWRGGSEHFENINPSDTNDVIGTYPLSSVEDVNEAATVAREAQPAWWHSGPQVRANILEKTARLIEDRAEEIGVLLSREEGKTRSEGVLETLRAAQIFKYYAQESIRLFGTSVQSVRPGVEVTVDREPIGVVGLITPWNFPIAIPSWKVAPALCYGNTVLLKPSEYAPACAQVLAESLQEAGIPDGVFNLIHGKGNPAGGALVGHPFLSGVSFTGSTKTGKAIAAKAISTGKAIQMEMGGKNPMIVMADANCDTALDAVINSAFFSTGQRCTAASRIIVEKGIYEDFCTALIEKMQALRVGHALAAETQIGPVAYESQLQKNESYIELAKTEGARIIGGERLARETHGFFQAPALFLNAKPNMRSSQEEIFGPCASVLMADDFDHAVRIANDTEFGLSAGICTTNLRNAQIYRRMAQAGMVMVNLPTAGVDYHVPFGGTKGSSYGSREQGRQAADFYTKYKTTYLMP